MAVTQYGRKTLTFKPFCNQKWAATVYWVRNDLASKSKSFKGRNHFTSEIQIEHLTRIRVLTFRANGYTKGEIRLKPTFIKVLRRLCNSSLSTHWTISTVSTRSYLVVF